MYKVLGADKQEYGPVSGEVLRQWIVERRANAQTLVQAVGTADWRPLSSLPEFADLLAGSATLAPGAASPAAAMPGAGPRRAQGLAVTSMVFGILGMFCLGLIAGLPAIIMGHIAHQRTRRDPARYGGAGFAIAGFAMGYVSLFMTALLAGLLLPAVAKAKSRAQAINCVNNLKQIGLAARMYANDNKETFPTSFLAMSNELASPRVLVCPQDSGKVRVNDWTSLSEENISYQWLAAGLKEDGLSPSQVIARCPIHNHTCLADGAVLQGNRGGRPMRR